MLKMLKWVVAALSGALTIGVMDRLFGWHASATEVWLIIGTMLILFGLNELEERLKAILESLNGLKDHGTLEDTIQSAVEAALEARAEAEADPGEDDDLLKECR